MQYIKARKIADRLLEIFSPGCEVIDEAGSVRREKPEVKDIEICCIPKEEFIQTDLLGGGFNRRIPAFTEAINQVAEKIIKGKTDGRYMQIILKGGATLDLFMPEKKDYYRQYAIRTGNAEYSTSVIAQGWRNKGWCGSDLGLRRITDCVELKGGGWKCCNPNGELPPVWKSEREFFAWIDVDWVEPRLRNL